MDGVVARLHSELVSIRLKQVSTIEIYCDSLWCEKAAIFMQVFL